MRKRKGFGTTIMVILAILIAGGGIVYVFRQSAGNARAATTTRAPAITDKAVVDVGAVVLSVNATGSVATTRSSNLTFSSSGVVNAISVTQGQQVTAGQILATLDSATQQTTIKQAALSVQAAQASLDKVLEPVSASDLAIAEADVKASQAGYQAKAGSVTAASVNTYQARLAAAQSARDDAYKLMNDAGGRYSKDDPNYQLAMAQAGEADLNLQLAQLNLQESQKGQYLGASQASIEVSKAKLAQLMAGPTQSDIDSAQATLVAAQAQLDIAKHQLANTFLSAPFAGTITTVNIKLGQPAQGVAMVLTDLSSLYVSINVDESDIRYIQSGQAVTLTFDALSGNTYDGKVDRLSPLADTTTSVISYAVRVLLDKPDSAIRPGMTANATFIAKTVDNVVRVPNTFLRVNVATNQTTVNVINADNTTVTVVPVVLGVAGSDFTEVITGLKPGDTVALVSTATTARQN